MAAKNTKTVKAVLITDAKRVRVYGYGKDGRITVNKRIADEEELDLVEEITGGNIVITNSSDCRNTIDLFGIKVDEDALSALGSIFD